MDFDTARQLLSNTMIKKHAAASSHISKPLLHIANVGNVV